MHLNDAQLSRLRKATRFVKRFSTADNLWQHGNKSNNTTSIQTERERVTEKEGEREKYITESTYMTLTQAGKEYRVASCGNFLALLALLAGAASWHLQAYCACAFLASFAIKNSQKHAAVYARKLGSKTS